MSHYQESIMEMLPDSYEKGTSGNIYKLFECITPEYDLFYNTCQQLMEMLDYENASGMTLTHLAMNMNQARGNVNDYILKALVKAKIMSSFEKGTIPTIIKLTNFITSQSDEVSLSEENEGGEPAAFKLYTPIDGVLNIGMTLSQFVAILASNKATGVRVIADLQGTFELGEIGEYGPISEFGFADTDQTTGGQVGILYDPQEDDPLPI